MAYQTITESSQFQQKIRRSSFHCFLFPIASVEEARILISSHNKEYANATHNCFAYVCGFDQEIQYYSDAGEPHGTAGKPILNSLLRAEMTNVLAIVTRHYGGVKLGVKGLIDAYGGTVEKTLELAKKVLAQARCRFVVSLEYAWVDQLTNLVNSLQGSILESNWSERADLTLLIPETEAGRLQEFLDGLRRESRLDYHREET